MTLNPNLHVGWARWTRPGRGSPELVYVISVSHTMGRDVTAGTLAKIRRADDTIKDGVHGTALVNCEGAR